MYMRSIEWAIRSKAILIYPKPIFILLEHIILEYIFYLRPILKVS